MDIEPASSGDLSYSVTVLSLIAFSRLIKHNRDGSNLAFRRHDSEAFGWNRLRLGNMPSDLRVYRTRNGNARSMR